MNTTNGPLLLVTSSPGRYGTSTDMDLKVWFRRRFIARILWTPCGYRFPHSDVMCGYTAHHFDNFSQLIRPAERVTLVSIYYSIYCLPPRFTTWTSNLLFYPPLVLLLLLPASLALILYTARGPRTSPRKPRSCSLWSYSSFRTLSVSQEHSTRARHRQKPESYHGDFK